MAGIGKNGLIEGAGGLLWRRNEDRQEILIHRNGNGGWALPAGLKRRSERIEQTALREVTKVAEEYGYQATLLDIAGNVCSYDKDCSRVFLYWNMQAEPIHPEVEPGIRPPGEEEKLKWLPVTEAVKLLRAEEQELLKQEALHALNGFGEFTQAFQPFPLLQPSEWYERLFMDPSFDRLRNYLESYYQEMWHLEAVVIELKVPGFHNHFLAIARLLEVSKNALKHGDVDYGWGA